MVAGLFGLVGVSLWLIVQYLCDARFIDSWGSSFTFFFLLGAPIVLLIYWIVRLVIAFRRRTNLPFLFLGIEFILALGYQVIWSGNRPLAYRVQGSQTVLEQAAFSLPQGSSKSPRTIGSFTIRNITRKDKVVWFECWDGFLGVEGIAYSPTPNIPNRQSFECSYQPLTGNWYFWYEDHF